MGTEIKEFKGDQLAKQSDQSLMLEEGAARAEMEVQSQVLLARRFPRNESEVFKKLLATCKRKAFAEKAVYVYPRGATKVIGPSINLAKEMSRLWGNIQAGVKIIADSDDSRTIRGIAWDLESNAMSYEEDTFKKLIYRKGKDGAPGSWKVPDERDLRELTNKRGAIVKRNSILALLPRDLAEEAVSVCLSTMAGKSATKPANIQLMIESFMGIAVSRDMLITYLKCEPEAATPEQIAELRGIYQSIMDGNSRKEEYFVKDIQTDETEIKGTVEEGLFETPATSKQINFLYGLAKPFGIADTEMLKDFLAYRGTPKDKLTVDQASELIKKLEAKDATEINEYLKVINP